MPFAAQLAPISFRLLMFYRHLAHRRTAFVSVYQRLQHLLILPWQNLYCFVAHHQQSRMTYVHLLLNLYCFGAILTHLCCVRQQLRLCIYFVHSPPSPVPIGQSLLLCAQFGVILILCVYLRECLLQAPGCLSKLVRSTD